MTVRVITTRDRGRVVEVRGVLVMLARDVAESFGVETREVVQNIKSNPVKLPERYAFQLNAGEVEALRSAGLISKPGRGGSRALPWALTQKGVIRLATIMSSPRALEATDLVIDLFTEVVAQLLQGQGAIAIRKPARLIQSGQDANATDQIRRQIAQAVEALLQTPVGRNSDVTVQDELGEMARTAMSHIREYLRSKKVSNERIEAEAMLIVEQTRDLFERRQADLAGAALDRERKGLENFEKRIGIVERLLRMSADLEPNAIIGLLPGFTSPGRPGLPDET